MGEFLKSWKFTAIIVAVLAVCAIFGVIYGVATHEEAGLSNPEARWDHVPLTVYCEGYPTGTEGCDAVTSAMDTVNTRLGFPMLVATTDDEADIVVTARAPVDVEDSTCGSAGECFELIGSSNVYHHCEVRTMNVTGGGDLEWLVSYHGFGHCLGLAHDDFEQSIMRPVQSETPDGRLPPWISDHDRELLRNLYAPIRR
jgi:hypothetical protein